MSEPLDGAIAMTTMLPGSGSIPPSTGAETPEGATMASDAGTADGAGIDNRSTVSGGVADVVIDPAARPRRMTTRRTVSATTTITDSHAAIWNQRLPASVPAATP